uniref:SURP and G-patch domain-containing protein 1-like protein n=1 Tax=Oryza punctata TaxID=4537 RepID=A0A0E0LZ97_ORYPU
MGDKGLFANDGSFMERFKQMQEKEKEKVAAASSSAAAAPKAINPKPVVVTTNTSLSASKRPLELKGGEVKKAGSISSGAKLAFSLKKNKVTVAPVKFAADDEEDEEDVGADREEPVKRQKYAQPNAPAPAAAAPSGVVAPSPPNDMTVKQVADKLANFVAKNGRQFENVTRQRNPGDTPFKFLFDKNCSDYKYYEFRLSEEEMLLAQSKEAQASKHASSSTPSSRAPSAPQRSSFEQKTNYQTPASALYGAYEGSSSQGSSSVYGEPPKDPVALMEFYMKKAAQEERKRPLKQSKDEMPPPPSLQGPSSKKGHHMGDFIPQEELEKFMARCNDAAAQKATKEAAEKAKIQADNIGHKLLSKMGWREGEGLGSERSGRADPIMAGDVKKDHLGVGAVQPGEVTSEDDIYEQYKKRMMLGYRYRPNPLNNPRKAYY